MAHPASITDDQVFIILDRLDESGARISPNRVRTEAGGGNPARYRALIERWRIARVLESAPGSRNGPGSRTALVDAIASAIEVGLFLRADFLDRSFRARLARDLAGQVGSSLIRRGLASDGALDQAPPDPLQQFLAEGLAEEEGGGLETEA